MSTEDGWTREKESEYLYRVLAESERSPAHRMLFSRLSEEASAQASLWAAELRKTGGTPPASYAPSARVRLVARLIRSLGPRRVRPILAAMKVRGMSLYTGQGAAAAVPAGPGHAMPTSVEEVGRRHRGAKEGGTLRAAVFGVNDGLVSNASLVLGVAGALEAGSAIVISGIAGLLAGAFSMAAGEYVSVRSQREMFERQIAAEREELARYPAEEAAELALIYEARGLPGEEARRVATSLIANPEHALDSLAREELGLDPDALGSPSAAALSSFLAFAAGAAVPLLPFLVSTGDRALAGGVVLTALALFVVGAVISLFTGRSALWSGVRMLLIGGAAATTTFLIGKLLGVRLT
jgi:VIT1/CCC1 family predicted Fe2+/Mn2+ transporter